MAVGILPINAPVARTTLETITAQATSVSGTAFPLQGYVQATFLIDCTAVTGTSPTLIVRVQKQLPDGATYQDMAASQQFTTTGKKVIHLVSGGNLAEAQQARALAAGTTTNVPFGALGRIDWAIAGTNPAWTCTASIEAMS